MSRADDFQLQQSYTDDALRVDEGYYPDDRGPNQYSIHLFDAQTSALVVEMWDVGLVGDPVFGTAGVVTLTLQHHGAAPVPVRIDTRAQTCAFHPMHEEPLADLNTRLASFWPPPASRPVLQAPPSREGGVKLLAGFSLMAFGGLALFAVERWHWKTGPFWLCYGLGFLGMIATVLLFTLRNSFPRR